MLEVKELEGHGGWLPWLAGRGINEPTARRAMELAQHHEYLTEQRPDQLQDFVNRSPLQALAIGREERVTSGRAQRPRQQTPPVPAPVSNEELEAIGRCAVLDDEAPLALGDESISFGDLGPAAQTQIQAAITQPVQRPVPMPTNSAAGSPVEMTTERVARLLWTELGISRCSQITKHWNRWAVEEALESPRHRRPGSSLPPVLELPRPTGTCSGRGWATGCPTAWDAPAWPVWPARPYQGAVGCDGWGPRKPGAPASGITRGRGRARGGHRAQRGERGRKEATARQGGAEPIERRAGRSAEAAV